MDEKAAFFEKLYKYTSTDLTDDDEPSAEDLRLAALFSANRKARESRSSNHNFTTQRNVPNTTGNYNTTTTTANIDIDIESHQAQSTIRNPPEISKPTIAKMPKRSRAEDATPSTLKKAKTKKNPPPRLQPASRQIFTDLTFFFIKPSLKRPERKMRIEKATEYGATVLFDFPQTKNANGITHIIVDSDIKFHEVLEFLKVDVIPDGIAVVNPKWAGDCIRYGKLVDPADFWYQVPGCPTESQKGTHAPAALDVNNGSGSIIPSSPPSSLQVQSRPAPKPNQEETPTSSPPDPPRLSRSTPTQPKDALDEAIQECLANDPINIEDFLNSSDTENASSSSESTSPKLNPRRAKNPTTTTASSSNWQSHFQCMHKHDGKEGSQNPNTRTIQVLEEMMRVYDDMRDEWRTRSYRIAISTLKKSQNVHISTYEQAIALPGVGDRLAKKIVEIVTTDRLQRLEYAKLNPQDQILKLFHGIYGVGLVQARKFVAAGYTTLEDVKKHATLTDPQRIGVERYDDFKQRIPREEVARHGEIVAAALKSIDKNVESYIMGSYRRGAKDCGDIDIILTKPGAGVEELHEVLETLVGKLFEQKFLMCGLAIARHDDGTKWHGASKLPDEEKPWRRIDFLVVPGEEIGAAFLYFTGNDVFNRSMRLLASKKGMRLNQKGLYRDVMRGKNREKMSEGTLLESKDEKRIFEILGVPYRPPEHRIC